MKKIRFSLLVSIGFTALFAGGLSLAQSSPESEAVIAKSGVPREAIAAVINDKVISTYDVRQRMKLMIISSGVQIPDSALPQLQTQALRDLIEEKLKLQEAKKYEVEISDTEVLEEISIVATQSQMTYPQLVETLKAEGISIKSMEDQIKASIAWPDLVQGRFRDRVRINKDEVEDTLQRMRDDASKQQFLISEICIPVDDPAKAQQYYQGALQLIEQMRQGVPFTVVAQQFSACSSAAVGGDMGWVRAGELPTELDGAIQGMPVGAVTNPIPSEGAFMILAIRDKREAVIAGEPTFTLAHATATKTLGENTARLAFDKLSSADACSGRALRIDLGEGVGVTLLENMTLGSIDPRFSEFIEDLNRGDTSAVIKTESAYNVAYVCDKDEGLGLPSREALENRIFSRQLSRIGQQYLRDIERQSLVDVKLKELLQPNG